MEQMIAYHCGPSLAGIKPSNLVTCIKSKFPNVHKEVERLNKELNSRDIYIEILCECEKRALLMVYRKKVLSAHLQKSDMYKFLQSYGYPCSVSCEGYIAYLKTRMKKHDFPHEVGIFLGYPLEDIDGFIHHRDEGCVLIGDWKVYGDAEGARKIFKKYEACRNAISKRVKNGFSLAQIFCAA